ncbi:MAG TPA: hypothetical protein VL371_05195, partial [Gemmataceae bacterium]|nr:hypothetical protein [Gemmataceae bacterium]
DLPYIGAAFRYRTQLRQKTELLVILTPHIIRTQEDHDRIGAEEARRMHWIESDVVKIHGSLPGLYPTESQPPVVHVGPGQLIPDNGPVVLPAPAATPTPTPAPVMPPAAPPAPTVPPPGQA